MNDRKIPRASATQSSVVRQSVSAKLTETLVTDNVTVRVHAAKKSVMAFQHNNGGFNIQF